MSETFSYESYELPMYKVGTAELVSQKMTFTDEIDGWKLVTGDYFRAIEYEGNNQTWFYFSSPVLKFALKKRWSNLPSSWEFKGVNYNVVGNSEIKLAGQNIKVINIKATSNADLYSLIYYSPKRGIVAFTTETEQRLYLLASELGIGLLDNSN